MELSCMYSAQLLSLYITSPLCNKVKAALALHFQTCHAQTGLLSGIEDLGHQVSIGKMQCRIYWEFWRRKS